MQPIVFIKRQIDYLRRGELGALLMFLWFPLSIPAVIVMRLIQPVLLVRLLNLQANSMGGLVLSADIYVREKKLGVNVPKQPVLDLAYSGPKVVNKQLLAMWNRVLPRIFKGWSYWFLYSSEWVNRRIPGSWECHFLNTRHESLEIERQVPPYLMFNDDEEVLAQAIMDEMGLPPTARFVGLLVRDSAYMASFQPELDDTVNNFRNCEIDNFVLLSEELVCRGYYVVRMGARVSKPLRSENRKIIDYATSKFRSDLMDIYLAKKCSLFMTTFSGFDRVSNHLFNKQAVGFDAIGIADIYEEWNRMIAFVSKKYFDSNRHCYLSMREIVERGLENTAINFQYFSREDNALRCIENSPEEIVDAAIEALERLDGTWKPHPEDEELQKKFWSYLPIHARNTTARFSAHFLRKNHEWFLK